MSCIQTGVRDDPALRESFHELTRTVFGFDLAGWHSMGCWDDRYQPHVIVEDGRVVANVSTTLHRMLVDAAEVRAVQVGTVMTHPDHRKRGLAGELLAEVVERYRDRCDLMFLYCDEPLFPFYARAGFDVAREVEYRRELDGVESRPGRSMRPLDPSNPVTISWLREQLDRRAPISNRFCALDGAALWLYHAAYRFPGDLFYVEELDTILILRRRGEELVLVDIVSPEPVTFADLLPWLPVDGATTLRYGFAADRFDPDCTTVPWPEADGTMVLGRTLPAGFRRQETSMA